MEYYIEPETFVWPYNGHQVYFACSVNNWEPVEMKKKDGQFVHEMVLLPGVYEYKFVVDGKWCYDIMAPLTNDGFGGKNNIARVRDNQRKITVVHTTKLFQTNLPDGDILICSGNNNVPIDRQLNEWFGKQKHPHKIMVLANSDLNIAKKLSNVTVLSSGLMAVLGINIFAFGGTDSFEWDKITNNIDILVTTCPPFGIFDDDKGVVPLMYRIQEVQPQFHLFGIKDHHHLSGNRTITWYAGKKTTFLNSSGVTNVFYVKA